MSDTVVELFGKIKKFFPDMQYFYRDGIYLAVSADKQLMDTELEVERLHGGELDMSKKTDKFIRPESIETKYRDYDRLLNIEGVLPLGYKTHTADVGTVVKVGDVRLPFYEQSRAVYEYPPEFVEAYTCMMRNVVKGVEQGKITAFDVYMFRDMDRELCRKLYSIEGVREPNYWEVLPACRCFVQLRTSKEGEPAKYSYVIVEGGNILYNKLIFSKEYRDLLGKKKQEYKENLIRKFEEENKGKGSTKELQEYAESIIDVQNKIKAYTNSVRTLEELAREDKSYRQVLAQQQRRLDEETARLSEIRDKGTPAKQATSGVRGLKKIFRFYRDEIAEQEQYVQSYETSVLKPTEDFIESYETAHRKTVHGIYGGVAESSDDEIKYEPNRLLREYLTEVTERYTG